MTEKDYFIVWNSEDKQEGVVFDDYNDASQTSTGEFQNMSPAIGERFFELYEDNAPLIIEKINP